MVQIIFNQQTPNAREAYLPDGARLFVRGGAEVFNAGTGRARKLGGNFEEQIRELHSVLEYKRREVADISAQVRDLRAQADVVRAAQI